MVTTPSSMIIEAEALSERDKEIVAAGYAVQAEKIRINELTKERFDAIGSGDISVELCQSTFCDQTSIRQRYLSDRGSTGTSQVMYQSNQYVNDKDTLYGAFLPITNLFDNVPDFPKIDPTLLGFLAMIFIASVFIGRQFSRKKRIARRNRKLTKKLKQRHHGPLVVTPAEHRRIQEFEANFITVGKSDPEYFLHVTSGAELIDASRRGNELYSIDTIIPGRTLKILKYRDPSTGQLYISFVPDDMDKADDAMGWKFHLNPGGYGGLGAEA